MHEKHKREKKTIIKINISFSENKIHGTFRQWFKLYG